MGLARSIHEVPRPFFVWNFSSSEFGLSLVLKKRINGIMMISWCIFVPPKKKKKKIISSLYESINQWMKMVCIWCDNTDMIDLAVAIFHRIHFHGRTAKKYHTPYRQFGGIEQCYCVLVLLVCGWLLTVVKWTPLSCETKSTLQQWAFFLLLLAPVCNACWAVVRNYRYKW